MLYYYIWKDATISIIGAEDEHEAADILDEIGEVDMAGIKELPTERFMVTFAATVCPKVEQTIEDDGLRVIENGEHSEELDEFLGDTFDILRSAGKLKRAHEIENEKS